MDLLVTRTRSFLRGYSPFRSNHGLFLEFTAGELDMTCFALLFMLLISLSEGFTLAAGGGPNRDQCGHYC